MLVLFLVADREASSAGQVELLVLSRGISKVRGPRDGVFRWQLGSSVVSPSLKVSGVPVCGAAHL